MRKKNEIGWMLVDIYVIRRPVADNTFPLLMQACLTRRKSIISHRAYCVIFALLMQVCLMRWKDIISRRAYYVIFAPLMQACLTLRKTLPIPGLSLCV